MTYWQNKKKIEHGEVQKGKEQVQKEKDKLVQRQGKETDEFKQHIAKPKIEDIDDEEKQLDSKDKRAKEELKRLERKY